jgi:hypothetical protein
MYRWIRCFVFISLFLSSPVKASVTTLPQWWIDLHNYNGYKPWNEYFTLSSAYFGPNALPVPEVGDGRMPEKHQLEFSTDVYWGFGDQTQSFATRGTYVLVPGRVCISVWGVLAEHYRTTIAIRNLRASLIKDPEQTLFIGDFYFSTKMRLLEESRHTPDLNLEVALKTASSATLRSARYMDTPGYYVDLTAGKTFPVHYSFFNGFRLVGQIGFLSYQLNQEHQNDAPLYGGKVMLLRPNSSVEVGLNGYSGWMHEGGDHPLVLRGKYQYVHRNKHYFIQYQHAFRDYPYRRLQTGIAIDL